MERPIITAHAGSLNMVPNTMESIENAIKHGAEIVEVDVRTTSDGEFVISHDDMLRDEVGEISIRNNTLSEIKSVIKEIVCLEDVFLCKKRINLDFKEVTYKEKLLELIIKYDMVENTIITGCKFEEIVLMKDLFKEISIYLNTEKLDEELLQNYDEFIMKSVEDALVSKSEGINIDYRYCSQKLVTYAKQNNLNVCVWTIDHPNMMRKFINLGVYSITTHEIIKLRNLLEEYDFLKGIE